MGKSLLVKRLQTILQRRARGLARRGHRGVEGRGAVVGDVGGERGEGTRDARGAVGGGVLLAVEGACGDPGRPGAGSGRQPPSSARLGSLTAAHS